MNDLDAVLARLRDAPADPRLGDLESRVMAQIASIQASPTVGTAAFGAAAVAALVIGIAGSVLPVQSADASAISPFDAKLALAPSTLLGTQ